MGRITALQEMWICQALLLLGGEGRGLPHVPASKVGRGRKQGVCVCVCVCVCVRERERERERESAPLGNLASSQPRREALRLRSAGR
jgi:hypothetical protein